jgi:CHASE3 domain sensor protein
MTIRRKLYFGFGAILAIMLALLVVNMFTVVREHAARSAAAATLSDVEIIENIRFQMMENRLFLENYLLSGDLRDEEKTNKGIASLLALLRDGESKGTDSNLRAAFGQVEENEHN